MHINPATIGLTVMWLVFVIWTIRRLSALSSKHEMAWKYGVVRFAVSEWAVTTLFCAVLSVRINPEHSLWYYSAILAFFLLPVCLWGGYAWGRLMNLFFPK
jgi:hypothetical protein